MNNNSTLKEQKQRSSRSSDVFNESILEEDLAKVKILLKYGGDCIRLNDKNKLGLNALQQSCEKGNLALVMLLLDHGACMELKDSNGWTALHFAVAADKCSVVRFLINSCADLTVMTTEGQLPIDLAKSDEMVLLLAKMMEKAGYEQTAALYREKLGLDLPSLSDEEMLQSDMDDINTNSCDEESIYWKVFPERQRREFLRNNKDEQ